MSLAVRAWSGGPHLTFEIDGSHIPGARDGALEVGEPARLPRELAVLAVQTCVEHMHAHDHARRAPLAYEYTAQLLYRLPVR